MAKTLLPVQGHRFVSGQGTGDIPYAATEDPVYHNRPGIAELKKYIYIECSKVGMLVYVSPVPWITFLTITDL